MSFIDSLQLYKLPIIGSFMDNPNEAATKQAMGQVAPTISNYRPQTAQYRTQAGNAALGQFAPARSILERWNPQAMGQLGPQQMPNPQGMTGVGQYRWDPGQKAGFGDILGAFGRGAIGGAGTGALIGGIGGGSVSAGTMSGPGALMGAGIGGVSGGVLAALSAIGKNRGAGVRQVG